MKYSVNQGSISNFVVGGARSECGPPVAVIWKTVIRFSNSLNLNETIEDSSHHRD
ncbi:hypothetical protein [Desulfocicer vacuolatum]|uniref:hypothetical protein n=1 Tax=Desulfocicer vacuolatum TaxID=2298 RepID=UPI001BB06600|nr:hypothetical protein [Desulfocicer vacuolatum]